MDELQLDEATIAAQVNAERFRVFRDRWVQGAKTAPLGIVFIAWVIYLSNGWLHAAVWATVMAAFQLTVIVLTRRHQSAELLQGQLKLWERALIYTSFVSGLWWSASVWFTWSPEHQSLYILNLGVLAAVSGISIMLLSPVRRAQLLYAFGMTLPPLVHFVWADISIGPQLAAGWMVLFVLQASYAAELKRELIGYIDATTRNRALVTLLTAARTDLQQSLEQVNRLVTIDQLTGTHTRRYMFEQLDRQAGVGKRHGTPVSLIMLDLDHFKLVNDRYGHPVGDDALRTAALAMTGQLREGDILARVGGEEFLVLLPMTGLAAAELLAERLRQTLADTTLPAGADTIHLPASFGVAELRAGEDTGAWYQRVDAALYQAKAQGRNTVVIAI